jgi:hypothetical protein
MLITPHITHITLILPPDLDMIDSLVILAASIYACIILIKTIWEDIV